MPDEPGIVWRCAEAEHSAVSDLATRAVNDNAPTPKPIVGYLNDVSSDATTNLGSTITFTRGDGSSKAIRVSDTTYDVFTTNTAGLVDGTNVTVPQDTTDLILSGSGWIDVSNIVIPTADSANKDGLGQIIAETYVKGLSYDTSTELLTVTQGDGTSSTVSIPDTTYSVFTPSTDGLVPAPSGTGESDKFLRGDHTWQEVVQPDDIYQGATAYSMSMHTHTFRESGGKIYIGGADWTGGDHSFNIADTQEYKDGVSAAGGIKSLTIKSVLSSDRTQYTLEAVATANNGEVVKKTGYTGNAAWQAGRASAPTPHYAVFTVQAISASGGGTVYIYSNETGLMRLSEGDSFDQT